MDQEGLYETARHEAIHALVSHWLGWPVLSLSASAWHDGQTEVQLPFTPLELPQSYRQVPGGARRDLTNIIAMTIAPSVVLGIPLQGVDDRDLQVWEYVWERCRYASDPYGPPWESLVEEARDEVHVWLAVPGCQEQLTRVAGVLARCHYLTGAAFLELLRPAQPARPAPVHRAPQGTVNSLRKDDTPCLPNSRRASRRVVTSPITVL